MAELKFYSCDLCNQANAIHLIFDGSIDLCPACLAIRLPIAIYKVFPATPELRYEFWKELAKKSD